MQILQFALVCLVLLINLVVAPPSWADKLNLTKNSDYIEVTQTLSELLQAKDNPDQSSYQSEEVQQKIGELKLQKYILETAEDWGQCKNLTGKTLAVYAHKPKSSAPENTLFFLGDGKSTDDDWDCDGVYLPTGVKVAGITPDNTQSQDLSAPAALKIVDGTQLVAKTNSETGAIEFNVTPAKVFNTGEIDWSIPELSQADIDLKAPNAPIDD